MHLRPRARWLPALPHLLVGCAAATQGGPPPDADLAITRVNVVDVARGRAVADQVVWISGNRITGITRAGRGGLPAGLRTIDGRGRYLIPGLWDMHAHLHLSGRPAQVEMPLFVAHGVTGIRIMGSDRPNRDPSRTPGLDQHRAWQAAIASHTLTGPRLLALASWPVNGPSGISDSMPAFFKARTREEGQQLARYFRERGFDFIKIYNNVSRDGYFGIAEEARRLALPFAGHEPGSVSAIEISEAGQASIEHSRIFLFNCWPGADSMRKGLLRSTPTERRRRMVEEYDPGACAEVFATFARNRTWITPTHGTRKMDAFADDAAYRADPRMKYIPLTQQMSWLQDADGMVTGDASRAGRQSYMDFYEKGLQLTRDAYRAGVPVMVGTDAGDSFVFPGSSVHDEMGELVTAGLTPAEALRAATLAGAEYLGRTGEFGTVEVGRRADLVLLDADPLQDIANTRRIHTVILDGRPFTRAALDSLLSEVEAAARPEPQQALWAGALRGDTAMIARALAAGARIDSLDTRTSASGRRALNYAAIGNRVAAIRMLLARGAGINLANNTGFTPVHHAAESGAANAIRVLIEAGADISIPNSAGVLPLETARRRNQRAAVELLEAASRR